MIQIVTLQYQSPFDSPSEPRKSTFLCPIYPYPLSLPTETLKFKALWCPTTASAVLRAIAVHGTVSNVQVHIANALKYQKFRIS